MLRPRNVPVLTFRRVIDLRAVILPLVTAARVGKLGQKIQFGKHPQCHVFECAPIVSKISRRKLKPLSARMRAIKRVAPVLLVKPRAEAAGRAPAPVGNARSANAGAIIARRRNAALRGSNCLAAAAQRSLRLIQHLKPFCYQRHETGHHVQQPSPCDNLKFPQFWKHTWRTSRPPRSRPVEPKAQPF